MTLDPFSGSGETEPERVFKGGLTWNHHFRATLDPFSGSDEMEPERVFKEALHGITTFGFRHR